MWDGCPARASLRAQHAAMREQVSAASRSAFFVSLSRARTCANVFPMLASPEHARAPDVPPALFERYLASKADVSHACMGGGGGETRTRKTKHTIRTTSRFPFLPQSVAALVAHPDADAAHAFPVDLLHVATIDPSAATALLAAPTAARASLASALSTAQTAAASAPTAPPDACVKRRVVPVLHPPPPPSLLAADVPARGVRARHSGALLTLAGAIVRAGGVRALEAATEWECSACGSGARTEADVALRAAPPPPPPCDGGGGRRACRGAWRAVATDHDDVQEVVLAEPAAGLRPRDRPRAVAVVLRGPLAGALAAGDDAAVCGVLAPRWPAPGAAALREGRRPDLDFVLLACGASRGREGVPPPPGRRRAAGRVARGGGRPPPRRAGRAGCRGGAPLGRAGAAQVGHRPATGRPPPPAKAAQRAAAARGPPRTSCCAAPPPPARRPSCAPRRPWPPAPCLCRGGRRRRRG